MGSYSKARVASAKSTIFRIVYVNPAFERITGYSSEEVLGRNARPPGGRARAPPRRAAVDTAVCLVIRLQCRSAQRKASARQRVP
ncbi:MAG: PAS domain S-box protein [Pseudomonadota bacterium]